MRVRDVMTPEPVTVRPEATVKEIVTTLIDNEITKKMSDLATSTVKAGFEIVDDVLTTVKDLSKPEKEERAQPVKKER